MKDKSKTPTAASDETPDEVTELTAVEFHLTALSRVGLHEKTVKAIESMAFEGVPLPQAAAAQNIRKDNLARAFSRPKVKRAFDQVIAAIRENAAQAAYLRINHLSHASTSDHVKLNANKWIAGVDGISPVQKIDARHQHNVTFGGFDYGDILEHDPNLGDSQSPAHQLQDIDNKEE